MLPWGLFAVHGNRARASVLTRSSPPPRPIAPRRLPQSTHRVPLRASSVPSARPDRSRSSAGPAAVLSPDGRTIVFRVRKDNIAKLFVRRLDQLDATELAGTENALNPFFSPDGASLGFFASEASRPSRSQAKPFHHRRAVTTLTDAATGRGAAWADNGDIIFQSSILPKTPLVRITAAGAATDRGTTLAPEEIRIAGRSSCPGERSSTAATRRVGVERRHAARADRSRAPPARSSCAAAFTADTCPRGICSTSTPERSTACDSISIGWRPSGSRCRSSKKSSRAPGPAARSSRSPATARWPTSTAIRAAPTARSTG